MTQLRTARVDITKLNVECVVNASNETGLGCFTPCHPCVDNAIHKAAGPGLTEECKKLGGVPETVAKITGAHSLPSRYIIHATGPKSKDGKEDHKALAKTYVACLNLAKKHGIKDIAFCCISTGQYGFKKPKAARTAIKTVVSWLMNNNGISRVTFATYTEEDQKIYATLLPQLCPQN